MNELVKKWREQSRTRTGEDSIGFADCADELEAAIQKGWPWRSVKDELPERGRLLLMLTREGFTMGRFAEWGSEAGIWLLRPDGLTPMAHENAPQFWMYADEIPQPAALGPKGCGNASD